MCCCSGWEPHLLPRSDERKRGRERGEQLTYPQHLTTGSLEKPSDGLLVYHLSDTQFAQLKKKRTPPPTTKKKTKNPTTTKRNAISVADSQPSGAFCQCALGSIGGSARENLDRRCAGEGPVFRGPNMAHSRLSSRKETRFAALT